MAESRTVGSSLPSCSTSFAGSVVGPFCTYWSFRYFATKILPTTSPAVIAKPTAIQIILLLPFPRR